MRLLSKGNLQRILNAYATLCFLLEPFHACMVWKFKLFRWLWIFEFLTRPTSRCAIIFYIVFPISFYSSPSAYFLMYSTSFVIFVTISDIWFVPVLYLERLQANLYPKFFFCVMALLKILTSSFCVGRCVLGVVCVLGVACVWCGLVSVSRSVAVFLYA